MSTQRQLSGMVALPDGSTIAGRVRFGADIIAVEPDAGAGADFIFPGLIDLQVNGTNQLNVMTESAEGIAKIAAVLAAEGTTAFLPTAITAPLEKIAAVDAAIATAMRAQESPAAQAAIVGMHLEGPFISPLRLGAHRKFNLLPNGENLERVLALATLRLITIAPELESGCAAIRRLVGRGVAVSLGHSDATYEQAMDGIAAGATCFTHLFNAMRPLNHREPGLIGAALACSEARVAVIPDGVHIAPQILKLAYRARGAAGVVLTTDKVAATGSIRIAAGAARLPDGSLTGSIISMLDGVRMMVDKAGASPGEAAMMAAGNPALVLGLRERGVVAQGARADLLVLDRALGLKAVFIAGREL